MEREYMRDNYKKDVLCKRWNGKEKRKRYYIDSINFDFLDKTAKSITNMQHANENINLPQNCNKKNNFIQKFIISLFVGIILFFVINFFMNNTIIF